MDIARSAANFQVALGVFLIIATVIVGIMSASAFNNQQRGLEGNYMKDSSYEEDSFEYKMLETSYSHNYMDIQLYSILMGTIFMLGTFIINLIGIFFLTQGIVNSHNHANKELIQYIDLFAILLAGSSIIAWLIIFLSLVLI